MWSELCTTLHTIIVVCCLATIKGFSSLDARGIEVIIRKVAVVGRLPRDCVNSQTVKE